MIPDYQALMLPVLKLSAEKEYYIGDAIERLAEELGLNDEEIAELLPSGRQSTFANRVHWAKTYLKQAGLLELPRRAYFQITDRGKQVLAKNPAFIDVAMLASFPEFMEFKSRQREPSTTVRETVPSPGKKTPSSITSESKTPDEIMREANRQANMTLGDELLDRILAAPPQFFERLIVNLLLAMGYGGTQAGTGRAIGKAGDDGVDGVIDQDTLGLDRVYIQAKRYKKDNNISSGAIRDFYGSLNIQKATKGLFVTTSSFTPSAIETTGRLGTRIVLVDGELLTQLMIRHNVGCRIEETLHLKRIDEDFFE